MSAAEDVDASASALASAAREGLLALAVGTGLRVLQAMLAEDVTRLVGAKGRPTPVGPQCAMAASLAG